jgi:integrase
MPKTPAKRKLAPPYLHASGQYVKKLKGRWYYYGTDKEEALAKWRKQQSYIALDIAPQSRNASPTLAELGNVYADFLRRQVASSELSDRTAAEYTRSIGRLVAIAGPDCRVEDWRPIDFGAIKEKLAEPVRVADDSRRYGGRVVKRRANTTVAIDIRNLRVFLNWCYAQKHIEKEPEYGKEFSTVSRKLARKQRRLAGRKDLSNDDVKAILSRCKPVMKAIVLLGINGAVGNQDIADIRLDNLPTFRKGKEAWIDLPRGKTGAPRRFLLWPETVEAIKNYLLFRPAPAGSKNRDRLFVTKYGLAWVRQEGLQRTDSIGNEFTKVRKAAGVKRGAFYDLRRTFRTVADPVKDQDAVDFIMGHVEEADDMGAVYNQGIDDDRLRAVCNHVRNWLFDEVTK